MRNIGGGKGFLEVQSLFYSKLSQLRVSGYPSIGIFSQIVVGLRLVSFFASEIRGVGRGGAVVPVHGERNV